MDEQAIETFWTIARERSGLSPLEVPLGPSQVGTVPPPTWSYGDTSAEADEFVAALLARGEGELRTPASDYAESGAEEPSVGDVSIVLDGSGTPRALVAVGSVDRGGAAVTQRLSVLYAA